MLGSGRATTDFVQKHNVRVNRNSANSGVVWISYRAYKNKVYLCQTRSRHQPSNIMAMEKHKKHKPKILLVSVADVHWTKYNDNDALIPIFCFCSGKLMKNLNIIPFSCHHVRVFQANLELHTYLYIISAYSYSVLFI